jgi:hypothetical protein
MSFKVQSSNTKFAARTLKKKKNKSCKGWEGDEGRGRETKEGQETRHRSRKP